MDNALWKDRVDELAQKLTECGIPFEACDCHGGYMVAYPSLEHKKADVVIHRFSYGNGDGLFEAYGFPSCGKDVLGWLTVEDALALFKSM